MTSHNRAIGPVRDIKKVAWGAKLFPVSLILMVWPENPIDVLVIFY